MITERKEKMELDKKTLDAFYGEKQKEKEEYEKERQYLLKELGKNVTPAMLLYASNKELKKELEKIKTKAVNTLKPIKEKPIENYKAEWKEWNNIEDKPKTFTDDIDKHEILREFAIYCYDNGKMPLAKGYKRLGYFHNKKSGFDSVVAYNDKTKELVIAFRGSKEILKDYIVADGELALNYDNIQQFLLVFSFLFLLVL